MRAAWHKAAQVRHQVRAHLRKPTTHNGSVCHTSLADTIFRVTNFASTRNPGLPILPGPAPRSFASRNELQSAEEDNPPTRRTQSIRSRSQNGIGASTVISTWVCLLVVIDVISRCSLWSIIVKFAKCKQLRIKTIELTWQKSPKRELEKQSNSPEEQRLNCSCICMVSSQKENSSCTSHVFFCCQNLVVSLHGWHKSKHWCQNVKPRVLQANGTQAELWIRDAHSNKATRFSSWFPILCPLFLCEHCNKSASVSAQFVALQFALIHSRKLFVVAFCEILSCERNLRNVKDEVSAIDTEHRFLLNTHSWGVYRIYIVFVVQRQKSSTSPLGSASGGPSSQVYVETIAIALATYFLMFESFTILGSKETRAWRCHSLILLVSRCIWSTPISNLLSEQILESLEEISMFIRLQYVHETLKGVPTKTSSMELAVIWYKIQTFQPSSTTDCLVCQMAWQPQVYSPAHVEGSGWAARWVLTNRSTFPQTHHSQHRDRAKLFENKCQQCLIKIVLCLTSV